MGRATDSPDPRRACTLWRRRNILGEHVVGKTTSVRDLHLAPEWGFPHGGSAATSTYHRNRFVRVFTNFTAVFCSTSCERLVCPLSWNMMTCRPQCLFGVLASDTLFLLLGETKTVRRQMFSRSTGAGHRLPESSSLLETTPPVQADTWCICSGTET